MQLTVKASCRLVSAVWGLQGWRLGKACKQRHKVEVKVYMDLESDSSNLWVD